MIGGGRTQFQPLHVEDAVRAVGALLARSDTAGTILALVGQETFAFRELLERMLQVLGRQRFILALPFPVAECLAAALEWQPDPPLTREDVRLLRTDKVARDLPTPASLRIAARPLAEGLPAVPPPTCLIPTSLMLLEVGKIDLLQARLIGAAL